MTDMDELAARDVIHLVARNPMRNIDRSYTIERSCDLFGFTLVEWRWGRTGTRGQRRIMSFQQSSDANWHIGALLRRRQSAPRRLGVAYRTE